MDRCFSYCGCDEYGAITNADLDRFTDRIENVLNDEKGRRFFKTFMRDADFRNGLRTLDFWENVDRLLNDTADSATGSQRDYFGDLDNLVDKAERFDELDLDTFNQLITARYDENREKINDVLRILKVEATKALKNEYDKFKRRYLKPAG